MSQRGAIVFFYSIGDEAIQPSCNMESCKHSAKCAVFQKLYNFVINWAKLLH